MRTRYSWTFMKHGTIKTLYGPDAGGGTGKKYDMINGYYVAKGFTEGTIRDKEKAWITAKGAWGGTMADRWFWYFRTYKGLTGGKLSDLARAAESLGLLLARFNVNTVGTDRSMAMSSGSTHRKNFNRPNTLGTERYMILGSGAVYSLSSKS